MHFFVFLESKYPPALLSWTPAPCAAVHGPWWWVLPESSVVFSLIKVHWELSAGCRQGLLTLECASPPAPPLLAQCRCLLATCCHLLLSSPRMSVRMLPQKRLPGREGLGLEHHHCIPPYTHTHTHRAFPDMCWHGALRCL